MNSPLLEQSAAAARIEAFRQGRTMQQAAGFRGGHLTCADFTLAGSRSFECLFRAHDPGSNFSDNQFLFSSYPLVRAPRAYVQKGYLVVGMTNDIVVIDPLTVDVWHHLVEVVDAAARTLTVYFDGAPAGTKRLAETLEDNQQLYVGSWGPVLRNRGDIGLLRAFDRALAADEAAALWNGGTPADFVVPAALKSSCAGEFLAQNIVADGQSVAAWLDSAHAQPFGSDYLPPLLESAGGCDLTASGALEIIYKESI